MKFEISELGNRIIVKTIKENGFKKITPLEYEKAIKTIINLQNGGFEVIIEENIKDYRIKCLM